MQLHTPPRQAPPFTANEVDVNKTLEKQEEKNGYGAPIRQFELASEFHTVTYAPKGKVWKQEVFIKFEITGLRHEDQVPKDIPFSGVGSSKESEGTVLEVTSVVRLVSGYTAYEEMRMS